MANVFSRPRSLANEHFVYTDDDPELGNDLRSKAIQKIVEGTYELGIVVQPFFHGIPRVAVRYPWLLWTCTSPSGDDVNEDATLNVLESFEVIANMRDQEGAKRALSNVPLQLEDGSSIAKMGSYPFYANMVKSIAERPRRGPLVPMRCYGRSGATSKSGTTDTNGRTSLTGTSAVSGASSTNIGVHSPFGRHLRPPGSIPDGTRPPWVAEAAPTRYTTALRDDSEAESSSSTRKDKNGTWMRRGLRRLSVAAPFAEKKQIQVVSISALNREGIGNWRSFDIRR
ncbi:hypothetical protein FRC09_020385 [Ceratobasidium sp. 395]|nr:hypothetical protein FRC09_020385 [Ceratobasidium sp. 395]